MATDGIGLKRGQFWNRSRDSSPSETTGWSGPVGLAGLLQAHIGTFLRTRKKYPFSLDKKRKTRSMALQTG